MKGRMALLLLLCAAASGAGGVERPRAQPPRAYLPGVTIGFVYTNLGHRGFACTGPKVGKSSLSWLCKERGRSADYEVLVVGKDDLRIRFITAIAFLRSGSLSDVVAPFFSFVATLPYQGAQPPRARRWVLGHLGGSGKLTIGAARFRIYDRQGAYFLQISAVSSTALRASASYGFRM